MDDFRRPLVCIFVPTYNVEKTIEETIASLLAQTYSNIAIHIVDNCSTDGTMAIAEAFNDPRITRHRNAENVGGEGNFNRCIALSYGDFTAIFHGDDVYETDMVARQVQFLTDHTEAGGVFAQAKLINPQGDLIGQLDIPKGMLESGPTYDFAHIFKAVLKHSNFLICPSFMARTHIYKQEIGTWRGEMFGSSADLDVWLRVLERHPCGILPEHLMRYRISGQQWSAGVRDSTDRADFFRVIDYYLQKPQVAAIVDGLDARNYELLERRDRAMRSVNALISGENKQAAALASGLLTPTGVFNAFRNRKGALTLMLGSVVQLAVTLRAAPIFVPILRSFKRTFNR